MIRSKRKNTIETATELSALLVAIEMVSDKMDGTDLKTLLSLSRGLANAIWENLNDAGFGE